MKKVTDKLKEEIPKEILIDLYSNKRNSAEKIGKILNKSKSQVLSLLNYYNIPRRKNTDKLNLIGLKIGFVEILYQEGYNSKRRSMWKCRCECGKEISISSSNLYRNKENISCGCRKENKYRKDWKGTKYISRSVYRKIYRNAVERQIIYDITEDYLEKLLIKQNFKCAYTGLPIECLTKTPSGSLDRIDNTKGYIKDNLVWCHKKINSIKGPYSLDECFTLCKLFIEYNPDLKFDLDLVDIKHSRIAKTREQVRQFLFEEKDRGFQYGYEQNLNLKDM